jgi:hypothetical protein
MSAIALELPEVGQGIRRLTGLVAAHDNHDECDSESGLPLE